MIESNPSVEEDVENLIIESEEAQLREQINKVPACFRAKAEPTWVFVGKCAMPYSEHLIPFRT